MREREIFKAALDQTDPAERAAYLDDACGGDAALRARIDALLASHESASQFLKVPAWQQLQPGDDPTARTTDFSADNGDDDDSPGAPDLSFLGPSTNANTIGTLGHYEILQVLGQGAFGLVFKAFDEKLHRHVAIKVMNPQLAATSPPRKRFLREARSAAAIKHENIVQVYSVEEQPLPYLVMEFVDGKTLKEKLENAGPLEVPEMLHLGRQMASGLAAAHAQGLIHRDIKPGNILIEGGAEQKVKITDFGLARAADDATMTRTGVISGTPMYMAPEQAQGTALDHRADLFSLGSVLYQMASGRPPFRGPTAVAVLKRVADEDPRPIREIFAEVPDWLCAIVGKLQAKRPEDRFQSAKEVADLLAACQAKLQQHGRIDPLEIGLPQTTPAADPHQEKVQRKPSTPSPAAREPALLRHRGIAAAAMLLVLFAGLGLSEATGVTKFSGTVIRLLSADGTLVVEVDDPGVSVSIDGEEIVITGTGAKEIRLKPGQYQVQASKDGQVLSQELVTVTTNGRQVVRVSREGLAGKVSTVGEPTNPVDADRRAAEKLNAYAQLSLKLASGAAHSVERGAPLPQEPFNVIAVFVPYGVENPKQLMSKVLLPAVADLTRLNGIASAEASVPCSDEELEQLVHSPVAKVLKGLTLELSQSERTFDLLKQFPNLTGVTVTVRDGDPKSLERLAELPHLTDLYWVGSTVRPITAEDAEIIARLKLKTFALVGAAKLDHSMLAALAKQPDLRFVELYSVGLVDSDVEALVGLKQVQQLQLSKNGLTDQALTHLASLSELQYLRLNKNKVTAEGVKALAAALPRCQILWDGGTIEPRDLATEPASFKNSLGMEFVLVPKGKAWLGGGSGKDGDKEVEFKEDFYLGVYEVTQEEWEKLVGSNPSSFSRNGSGREMVKDIKDADLQRFPVESISWDDAQLFLQILNQRDPQDGWLYRLPTESEWEYACRGGPVNKMTSAFNFYPGKSTNILLTDQANFGGSQGLRRTCIVGSYEPNALGLYDMHGNVAEWCGDIGQDNGGASKRVYRGGAWNAGYGSCRAAGRDEHARSHRSGAIGLRVARVRVDSAEARCHVNSLGMEFVLVPKGKAWLGGGGGKPGTREVEVLDDFYLGAHEVTQGQWKEITGLTPSFFSRTGPGKDAVKDLSDEELLRLPVECVSWDDAHMFLARLNERDPQPGWEYRLPTLAEREYACRGGALRDPFDSGFDFYFAKPTNELKDDQANFNKLLKRTCPVGSYQPNQLGLYDMHGNVGEWLEDEYRNQAGESSRQVRGGSWMSQAEACRPLGAVADPPGKRANDIGFRVVRARVRDSRAAETAGFFNGKDLTGWKGLNKHWQVEEGAIVGRHNGDLTHHTFLCTEKSYSDFELSFKIRFKDGIGNSGVQYRSKLIDVEKFRVAGPQAEAGIVGNRNLWGSIWGQDFGGLMAAADMGKVATAVKKDDFNDYLLKVVGKHVTIKINGTTMVDQAIEKSPDGNHIVPAEGIIALQLHPGPAMEVTFKDFHFQQLPKTGDDLPLFKNAIGMEFVRIPQGKAWIGGRGGRPGDKETEFGEDFYLGKYEVTQEQWEKVTGTNPSACKDKDIPPDDLKRYPVEHVNWLDCQEFIRRLNAQVKDEGWEYRLPTAAEWEYACRGGPVGRLDSAFDFYLDKPTNELSTEQANFNNAQKRPAKVGSYPSNQLGLCDMHGNVIEWCNDELTDDKGSPLRIHRGGCWKNELWGLKAGLAGTAPPTYGDNGFGLRVARVRIKSE